MRMQWLAAYIVLVATSAQANDWERYYHPLGQTAGLIPASGEPEVLPSSPDLERVLDAMWRRGFVAIGYSSFNTANQKTTDALRLAKKLKARYVMLSTNLTSSQTTSMPLTLPKTITSYTNGTASAYGSGGYASGTYQGTTTTYGSQTTYIPITVNRFDKSAVFFMEVPKHGAGIEIRDLTPEQISRYETRRGFVVRWVRDGSPAYNADLLPGDVVLTVNGQPADSSAWQAAIRSDQPLRVHLMRNDQPRDLAIAIPSDWRPSS